VRGFTPSTSHAAERAALAAVDEPARISAPASSKLRV
jgi:hypothetical protein